MSALVEMMSALVEMMSAIRFNKVHIGLVGRAMVKSDGGPQNCH